MNIITRLSLLALLMMGGAGLMSAQGYYDDDIYFNPTKDKDKNIEEAKKIAEREKARRLAYRTPDYPAADTYEVTSGSSTRNVDDYNRRGIFAYPDSASADSASSEAFAYTRKIERFYNPDVVTSSKDKELAEYYYAEPANINIIINPPYYGYWGYPSWGGWYGSSWYWDSPWYPYWGPSWSWNWSPAWSWGWGPSWSWGWGPSWSWGWGPAWGWTSPGWGWGWGGNVQPYNPRHPGALGHQGTSSRPGTHSGYRNPSSNRPSGNYRPSNSNYRPSGNRMPSGNSNGNSYRPSNTNNTGNTNSNYNSYSRPGRNSSGTSSFSSGGSSRGTSGGATRSSGGGGGRGRH